MKHIRGFTLVEMMAAIAILALLTAAAIPSMRTFVANAHIRGTAEDMRAGLDFARSESIRRNAVVSFVLNGNGWNVIVPGGNADGTGSDRPDAAAEANQHQRECGRRANPVCRLRLDEPVWRSDDPQDHRFVGRRLPSLWPGQVFDRRRRGGWPESQLRPGGSERFGYCVQLGGRKT